MNNVIKRSLLGLTLGLSVAGVQASQWVPIGSDSILIFIPVAGLGDIQTDTFHYGNEASVVFNDVGESSAVYYRVQNWVGDKASGGYDATADWQCVDKTQLAATNNTLTLTNITSGRYQITASAVMESGAEICDVTAYKAGQFNSSDVTAPAEFLVINHTTLDHTDGSKALLSRPDDEKYDLNVRWLPVTGSDSYQLNLNRDSVDYPLLIDADTYAQDTYYIVKDIYNAATDTFTPHTGFGNYTFSVQYQLNGQLSNAIAYTSSTLVRPLKPLYLFSDDYLTKNGVDINTVQMIWLADRRTTSFKVREMNNADSGNQIVTMLTDSFPGSATIIQENGGGQYRTYDHLLVKTEPGIYKNLYTIYACADLACGFGRSSFGTDRPFDPRMQPVVVQSNAQANFVKNMESWIVNPGQHTYVEDESGDYPNPNGLVTNNNSPVYTNIGPGDPTSTRTPVVSEEILNRLEVNPEINAETTALLGEQIDLNTGSVSFSHTDVSLPGNSGLPVRISRTHKGGNYSFQNTLEFADWQLDIPSIQTTLLAGHSGFSGGWGNGTACTTDQRPKESIRIRTDDYKAYEYFNGTTLSIPGVTNGKLLNARNATSGINTDPQTYRYLTKDNWRISCLTSSQTQSGGEGFKATSPQGVNYYFDRYRLVQGDPLTKDKHAPRYYGFMMVTKVEDRFGNFVTYNYNSNNQLTSIVGQDVGEATPRSISITYKTDPDLSYRIASVTANNRTWTYGYTSDPYVESTLTSVTRPDNTAWGYDLAEFSRAKVSQMGRECTENADTGYASGSVTHPSGAKGEFNWVQVVHGRSQVDGLLDDSNRNPLVPSCFANVSISSKKLTGPGLDEMLWTYQYSENEGSYVGENKGQLGDTLPSHMAKVDHKWIKVNNPDGSKTKHYFNRSYISVTDGLEVLTDYFDTDGITLLKRVESHYDEGGKNGGVELNTENTNPIQYRADLTKTVQTLYTSGVPNSTYTTENGLFNKYGKPTWSYGHNSVDTSKNQYTRTGYYQDTAQWVLDLPTTQEVSSNNSNWTLVSEKNYYNVNALPYYESSFGQWVKRYTQYSNGNLTKVEFNELMNDGNYRWQQFGNYKRGKAQTITLPGRDSAATTMNATLVVDDNGWVTSVINFNGEPTSYTYDGMGRVKTIAPGDTKWLPTNFTFEKVDSTDIAGDVVTNMYKREMSKGNFKSVTYFDGLFRPLLVKTTDTSAGVSRYQRKAWNIYGKESFSAYPSTSASESQGMTHAFDGLQRLIKTTQTTTGADQVTTYLNGHKTTVTSYNGDATTTTYLAYGEPKTEQMTRIDSPESVVTTQSYNSVGAVTAITQGGVTQSHFYNTQQQLCKVVRPDTGVTAYSRNTIGEIIWVATGASGSKTSCDEANVLASEKTTYTHDNLGANKTVNYPDATSADLTSIYDNQGNLKTLTAGTVVQNYNYYSGGVLKDETLSVDGKNFTVAYGYNSSQEQSSLTYPDGTVIDFAPNGFGEATKAAGFATNAKYYPDGQVNSFTFGNGVEHTALLNTSKMPSSITATKDLVSQSSFTVDEPTYSNAVYDDAQDPMASATGGASTTIMDYGYLYDNQGNLTNQTDKLNSAYSITGMTYDGLERLTAANGYWGNVSIGYDTLGNIQHYNFTNSTNLPSSTLAYNYNGKNQLESVSGSKNQSFEYDSRGNVTNNGKDVFDFNKAQQIMSAGGSTYVYDGHGRRVRRELSDNTVNYSLYSKSGKLLYREKDGQKVKYIFMGKQQVARIDAATQYIHTDLLGSPVVETNSSGSEIANSRMHYRPFGATLEDSKDEVGYTGHKFDADIGLSYMQQRYYDPEIGRFYSNDPVGYSAKNPVMSFNRYMYVNNNPYKYKDPDGEWLLQVIGAAVGGYQSYQSAKQAQAKARAEGKYYPDSEVYAQAAVGAVVGILTGHAAALGVLKTGLKAGIKIATQATKTTVAVNVVGAVTTGAATGLVTTGLSAISNEVPITGDALIIGTGKGAAAAVIGVTVTMAAGSTIIPAAVGTLLGEFAVEDIDVKLK